MPAVFGLLMAWGPAVVCGQGDPCSVGPAQVADASLHLDLNNGQSVFHEGEIIALTAEYRANSSNKYLVNNRSYDRSGRLSGEEVFCLEPGNGRDPLDDYFNSASGFMGGGLFSEEDPGGKPFIVNLELNEWESLPPGSYRLTIVGGRLSLGKEDDAVTWHDTPIPLRSNTIEFTVEPADPGWQDLQLATVKGILDSPSASEDEKKHAARVLRFLGSEASTRELARRYSSGEERFGWEYKFGLYGSPHRTGAVQAMKAELADPQRAVTREYVSTLVSLEMQSDPKLRLPAFDPKDRETWERARDAYEADFERRVNEYMQQASGAPKDAVVQAVVASEMLQSGIPLSPEAKARWRHQLLSNWSTLPIEKRNDLIENRWDEVGGAEWIPVLEQIVAGPRNPERALGKSNRAEALYRIYQLAPEHAQHLILEEIAHPQGDIDIRVLGQLTQHELPQFEAAWLARIRQGDTDNVVFQLVERYASVRALPELQGIYQARRGQWACIPQTAMLRYVFRVGPDAGVKELSAALGDRKTTGCYRTQLTELGEYMRLPKVEKVAIAALDDPEPSVARDAAQALQHYGTAAAEKALWRRLEKFHNKWKDKPDELLHLHQNAIEYEGEGGLENALVEGITLGQAWFADSTAIARLRELSSPAIQQQLDGELEALESHQFTMDLTWWPDDDLRFTLGWYTGIGMTDFKSKLAQFPSASRFELITTLAQKDAHTAEFAEAESAVAANGQQITIRVPR
jgi:hypothetical protein